MNWGLGLQNLKVNKILQFCSMLMLVLSCLLSSSASASMEGNNAQFVEYLAKEKINLTIAINAGKLALVPNSETQLREMVLRNNNMRAINRARISELEEFLNNQEKQAEQLTAQIRQLQQSTSRSTDINTVQERLAKYENLYAVNKKTIELIQENIRLAKQYETVLSLEKNQQGVWQAKFQLDHTLLTLHKKEEVLNQALSQMYQNNINYQQEKTTRKDAKLEWQYEAKILLNNLGIILVQQHLSELNLQKNLYKADYLVLRNQSVKTIQSITDTYRDAIVQLNGMEEALKRIGKQLDRDKYMLNEPALEKNYTRLKNAVKSRLEDVVIQQQTLQEDLENNQKKLKKEIATRQSLAEYKLDSWPSIAAQLVQIPHLAYNWLKSLFVKARDNYTWQDPLPATLLWGIILLISGLAFYCYRLLGALTHNKERSRLTGHLYGASLTLIYRNIPYLTFFMLLPVILYLSHIPYANYQLLINLFLVWLTFRMLILIARLFLLERISDASGKDVRLYYRLKWLFLAGGWITALMVFSHQLPLSLIIQDLFNRLFMLFILAISLVAWKSRDTIPHLLLPILAYKKRYIRNAISLLVILVPWTIFITAIIGLLGYINLAWTMSSYLAKSILVLTGYVLMRGLLFDVLDLISEWMIKSLQNGWLWVEVFLKPSDKIMRLVIFLLSILCLFQLFGWFADSIVIDSLSRILQYKIINVSGINITVASAVEFIFLLSFFTWASKWSREFCYRWLYSKVTDVGIKNSLSVFTQYAVIIIGGAICLRVLGIDFTGMSIVLGGLAVGMGFGLRDFASNIVGGLMLLIERPVREGDLITLGGYEGRVAHIGIRSMRVSSWDNMEVLIPNAETFNKPFTNWTHQDSIVRTVVPIKVSRADDPVVIQQLILDVLAIIPEILPNPPSQVFLKQIDDALIEFEIRYFINVDIHTRFEVRSNVLFAIMAQFKAAGVKAPIPPMQLEFKESERDLFIGKNATEV